MADIDAIVIGKAPDMFEGVMMPELFMADATGATNKPLAQTGSNGLLFGGIAAALAPEDSPGEHLDDTLVAGVGLCDEDAVEVLVTEGPARVRELIGLGARFDTDASGEITLTREGGHHRDRITHAGGDATGAEIQRALTAAGPTALIDSVVLSVITGPHGAAGLGWSNA